MDSDVRKGEDVRDDGPNWLCLCCLMDSYTGLSYVSTISMYGDDYEHEEGALQPLLPLLVL